MKSYFTVIMLFIAQLGYTQHWVYEFDTDKTTINSSWYNIGSNTIIYNVGFMSSSVRDYRTGLIELNKEGELVSYFNARNCNTSSIYYPYGRDSIVSVSRNCNGEWSNTFNFFNSQGVKVYTHEFENKYSTDAIIDIGNGISMLSEDWENFGNQYHIHELGFDGFRRNYSFSLDELKEDSLSVRVAGGFKKNTNSYYLFAQVYKEDQAIVYNLFPKIIYVVDGKIVWIKSLKGRLQSVKQYFPLESGLLLYGSTDSQSLLITLDSQGNEVYSFTPESCSSGAHQRFYFKDNRLFSIDYRIHGSTMFLHEYDYESGELLSERAISTKYWRISNMNIGYLVDDDIVLTGGFVRGKGLRQSPTAFVMRTGIANNDDATTYQDDDKGYSIQDLIQETSLEVLNTKVYPNPAHFEITFSIDEKNNIDASRTIIIYDLQGRRVKESKFIGNQYQANISDLANGAYIYTITTKNRRVIIKGKFVVQK